MLKSGKVGMLQDILNWGRSALQRFLASSVDSNVQDLA